MQLCFRNEAASDEENDDERKLRSGKTRENSCACAEIDGAWQRYRRPPKIIQVSSQLRVCFLDASANSQRAATGESTDLAMTDKATLLSTKQRTQKSTGRSRRPMEPAEIPSCHGCFCALLSETTAMAGTTEANGEDDRHAAAAAAAEITFARRQAFIRAEAQLAIAQAKPMARMQLELEKGHCVAGYKTCLASATMSELRLLRADLLDKIKGLNKELVQGLITRDTLHMEQDTMLVEVEDLSRRAHEIAAQLHHRDSLQEVTMESPSSSKSSLSQTSKSIIGYGPASATRSQSAASLSAAFRFRPSRVASMLTGTCDAGSRNYCQ